MWTSVHLSVTPVWDQVLWHVTATWADDPMAEPVAITKGGQTRAHPYESPIGLLAAVLADLEPQEAADPWESSLGQSRRERRTAHSDQTEP
jgi:hypothetical protein